MSTPKAWNGVFRDGFYTRLPKPRAAGLDVVIDKCQGMRALADLLDTAGEAIDQFKFAFGTSVMLDEKIVRDKIALLRGYNIDVYPGGTLCEVAIVQGVVPHFLKQARALGFTMVEVSDGTIHLPAADRADVIRRALDTGLKVITEVGKKDPRHQIGVGRMQTQINADLEHGASYVVIEARESGKGVGIFDAAGAVDQNELDALVNGLAHLERIIWEAPQTAQQAYLIHRFGGEVNLGNIPPRDVLALEALRTGMRFETLRPIAAERGMLEVNNDVLSIFLEAAKNSIGS
ncbi:MAG: phosphosulfolactate synthase [Chloroflexi bacterium]|nr:phosphosulfolactate synthase [Chloroflexota bacterium]